MLKLTLSDLQYMQLEVGTVNTLAFGDRPWEACLISQEAELEGISLGRYFLNRILERTKTDARAARILRTMLTVLFAPPYHARKFSLPPLAADRLAAIFSAYPSHERPEKSALEVDVDVAMHQVSPDWQIIFDRNIPAIQSSEDRYFLYCCAKLVIVQVCGDKKKTDDNPLEQLRKLEEAMGEMERLQNKISARKSANAPSSTTATGVTFDDVAGCHVAKARMMDLARLLDKPEIAGRWGVDVPRGILLNGPPGNGKTLMVRAMASYIHRPLFCPSLAELVSKWYGESIQKLRDAFIAARKAKGAILFFDEADGLVIDRHSRGAHEETRRTVTEFNIQMQSIQPEDRLLVVLATNIKEALDEAVTRDQRIDEIISVPDPDFSERIEVLDLHIQTAIKKASVSPFAGSLVLTQLASLTTGLSSAALAGIIQRALRKKCHADIRGISVGPVTQDDLEQAVRERLAERKTTRERIGFVLPEPPVQTIEILPDDDLSSLLDLP